MKEGGLALILRLWEGHRMRAAPLRTSLVCMHNLDSHTIDISLGRLDPEKVRSSG